LVAYASVELADYVVFPIDITILAVTVPIEDICGSVRLGAVLERRYEFHPRLIQAPRCDVAGC
jgi:hypothetical protein